MVRAPVAGAELLVAAGKLVKTHEAWIVRTESDNDTASSPESLSDDCVLTWISSVGFVRSDIRM